MNDKDKYKNYKDKKHSNGAKGGESKPVVVNDNNKYAHIEAIQAKPLEVKVYGGNFDKALRAFRTLVQKERILSTYKERQSYEKPSDKRRRKRNESKRKAFEACSKGFCLHEEHKKNYRNDSSE